MQFSIPVAKSRFKQLNVFQCADGWAIDNHQQANCGEFWAQHLSLAETERAEVKRCGADPSTYWHNHVSVSENSVPLNPMVPMVNDHYPYEKLLFHWEYTQHFQTNPCYKLGQTGAVGIVASWLRLSPADLVKNWWFEHETCSYGPKYQL